MFGRKKPPGSGNPVGDQKPAARSWHAVSVVPGPRPCADVQKFGQRRFLADEAPRLPVPGCEVSWRCQCVYKHFPDRRAGPRRAIERDGVPGAWFGNERRRSGGRRAGEGTG